MSGEATGPDSADAGEDRRAMFGRANARASARADFVAELAGTVALTLPECPKFGLVPMAVSPRGATPVDEFSNRAVTNEYDRIRVAHDLVAQLTLVLDGKAPQPGGDRVEIAKNANRTLADLGIPRLPPQESGNRMPQENPTTEQLIAANVHDALSMEKTLKGIIGHLAAVGRKSHAAARHWKNELGQSAAKHPIPKHPELPKDKDNQPESTKSSIFGAVQKAAKGSTSRPDPRRPGSPPKKRGRGRR